MKRVLAGVLWGMIMAANGVCQVPSADAQPMSPAMGTSVGNVLGFDKITFDFERAELTPPHWGFEIGSDGVGRYYERGAPTDGNASGNVWTDVKVSEATMALLKSGAERSAPGCETKAKHLAQTGKRVLTYWKGDVPFACTFNYSDNAGVMKAAEAFQAMAETMQYGERLQRDHRFDRLALDAEMDSLALAMKEGRAIEVQNIGPTLKSIAEDERVMERVRRKSARLLQDAGVGDSATGESAR